MNMLDEKQMKYFLHHRVELLHYIQLQRELLYEEICVRESQLAGLTLKSKTYSNITMEEGNGKKEIVFKIMEIEERINMEEILALREKMNQLTADKEKINRVWICFLELPLTEFFIIERLYVHGEKFSYVEQEMNINHKTFCTQRKKAIDFILHLYRSTYTNCELIQGAYRNASDKKGIQTERPNL